MGIHLEISPIIAHQQQDRPKPALVIQAFPIAVLTTATRAPQLKSRTITDAKPFPGIGPCHSSFPDDEMAMKWLSGYGNFLEMHHVSEKCPPNINHSTSLSYPDFGLLLHVNHQKQDRLFVEE